MQGLSRTINVIIDTSEVGGTRPLTLMLDVPLPISYDYLAERLAADGLPRPAGFEVLDRDVTVRVVDDSSEFDPYSMSGQINIDEPLCKFYQECYLEPTKPQILRTAIQEPEANTLSLNYNETIVTVGEVGVSFMRTLRVPDDGKKYKLPAGLGRFPLHRVEDFASCLPSSLVAKGDLLMSMHQREAMWISFEGRAESQAVKLFVGGINALTGLPRDAPSDGRQDYVTVRRQQKNSQMWLDGFSTSKGVVRQFVAAPSGQGISVESQLTGSEDVGGIQIDVHNLYATPRYGFVSDGTTLDKYLTSRQQGLSLGAQIQWTERWGKGHVITDNWSDSYIRDPPPYVRVMHLGARRLSNSFSIFIRFLAGRTISIELSLEQTVGYVKEQIQLREGIPTDQQRLVFGETRLENDRTLLDYGIYHADKIHLILRLEGGGYPRDPELPGLGLGGRIEQKIVRDTYPAAAYDTRHGARLQVTILSPATLAELTRQPPLPSPVTMRTYIQAGIPWFALYDRGTPAANNIASVKHTLAGVRSVLNVLLRRRGTTPPRFACCYCSRTASFELRPCGHLLCKDCADGLGENECPKMCSDVTGRRQVTAVAEGEAGWDFPEAGVQDERVVVLAGPEFEEDSVVGVSKLAKFNPFRGLRQKSTIKSRIVMEN